MDMTAPHRRLPVGAEVQPGGGVHFRVWAPRRRSVSVVLESGPEWSMATPSSPFSLSSEANGYFSGFIGEAAHGTLYRLKLDEEDFLYPDPTSRFQPQGPHGPSQVIDPGRFEWTDKDWQGVTMEGQIICEVHIGTFTQEGTYEAAARHLKDLLDIGITLLEIMPVADFPGRFGWGYDGVDLFAPTRLYGTPDDLRQFIDHAHSLGMGVILDVVYNHLGPSGNYLNAFSTDYFSDRYITEWGDAFNFDGKNSGPVREFFLSNAGYWIEEFHLDGFRLDATQQIFDSSCEHILKALTRHAREKARGRSIVILAENEPQEVMLVRSFDQGGFGMDGLMNDDFHHSAAVALTGKREAYYIDYSGSPQELISTAKWGTIYQGQYYRWQGKRRGTPTFGLKPATFVNYLQNHDQIANTGRGERIDKLTVPGLYRAMTALLLLSPGTPLLFQGQEFGASGPFTYFADHDGDLCSLVREGRLDFLKQFPSLKDPAVEDQIPDPSDPGTFECCKLDHSEREKHAKVVALHRDLIALRRKDAVFRAQRSDWMHGAILGSHAFCLRFLGEEDGDRLILLNFGTDLELVSAPEPLLAPPEDSHWEVLWSSEAVLYGGGGTPPLNTEEIWHIPGHAAVVLAPVRVVRAHNA